MDIWAFLAIGVVGVIAYVAGQESGRAKGRKEQFWKIEGAVKHLGQWHRNGGPDFDEESVLSAIHHTREGF